MAIIIPENYSLFEKINRLRETENKPSILILIKQRTKTSEGFKISSTLIENITYNNRIAPRDYSPDLVVYATEEKFPFNPPNIMP